MATPKQAAVIEMNNLLGLLGRPALSEARIRKMALGVVNANIELLKGELASEQADKGRDGAAPVNQNEFYPAPAPATQTDNGPVASEGAEEADDASLKEMLELAASEGADEPAPTVKLDWELHHPAIDDEDEASAEEVQDYLNGQFALMFMNAGGNQSRGICKALRIVARAWDGSRKEFLVAAAAAGLKAGNAAAEWQASKKRTD